MRLVVALLVILISWSANAQDTVHFDEKWRSYFESLASLNKDIYDISAPEFDSRYQPGAYYNILLVFHDKTSREEQVVFRSIVDFCDPSAPLLIKRRDGDMVSPLPKSKFAFFVFEKYTFKFSNPTDRSARVAKWGVVYLAGPISAIKSFYLLPSAGGGPPYLQEGHYTFKREHVIASDLLKDNIFGGFKTSFSKIVKEHEELAEKIRNEWPGYLKEDKVKILEEYNDWVRRMRPDVYARFIYHR